MIRHPKMGQIVKQCAMQLPRLTVSVRIQPITRTVLRVLLTLQADFQWSDKIHGSAAEPFWIWIEDPDNNHIYHWEYFLLLKKQVHHIISCL